jgi:SAM-dependent methyltransferase
MLDIARKKVEEVGARGVFFRTESASPRLSFADDVYDLVVCNLGLTEMASPARALADFARVTKPGGQVRCTLPLEGTFQEFYDIYREVLTKHDRHDTLQRLNDHLSSAYPTVAQCEQWMQSAGLDEVKIEVERFTMLFRSSREFFFAPVIEYGPLSRWKEIAGSGQEMQDVFWFIKEAIDAYFQDRAFAITVVAGCLVGRKSTDAVAEPPTPVAAPSGAEIELGTDDIDVAEVMAQHEAARVEAAVEIATEGEEEVELDAFAEGKKRPGHLAE